MFATFAWDSEEDASKIDKVLAKFEEYCQPRRNIPFERYLFNRRMQEPGESHDHYRTALLKLAEGCTGFHTGFFEKGGKPSDTPHLPGNSAYY